MVDQKPRSLPVATPARSQRPPDQKTTNPRKQTSYATLPLWLGLLSSLAWVGIVTFVILQAGPLHSFIGLSLTTWAIAISAIASPVALIWMVTAYLQRAADVQSIAEPLRRQLMMITGESGMAEARIRRFNQAVREQLDLLKSAQGSSYDDLIAIMDRVRAHKDDLERFEQSSIHQVKEIQSVIRSNMQHIENLMEDKFTMMRVLDDRLMQSGENVGRQTEAVRSQVTDMLDAIESNATHMSSALDRASSDSKKLSETSRMQEASLLTAAESAAEMLNGVSGKIDLSIARFLERAGSARGEAERLATTLEAQTRSLDEFSNTLPVRVSEAEAVLRGVADRLYASEQMAREQAVHLSDKLSLQVEGLQRFLDRLSERLTGIDGNLQNRRDDLENVLTKVGDNTDIFAQRWESAVTDLGERTNNALQRFAVVNDDTRKAATEASVQMAATAERYESAAHRMQSLSGESSSNLKAISGEIANQLGQFEALRSASHQAGQEVESRASSALQNLQYLLDRLANARDTTQTVGETLVKDLTGAVDQNEHLIGRLNEAAQMSVRALGIAAESLGRQEGELASSARSAEAMLQEAIMQTQSKAALAEKGLRDQAVGLMALLAETQEKLGISEQRLQSFTTQSIAPIQSLIQQVDSCTVQGVQSLDRYGEGVQAQLSKMQQFAGRVGGIGEELSRIMSENVGSVEKLGERFVTVRTAQQETARQTLEQFSSMADRLQHEIGSLGGHTTHAVTTLQQAAQKVAEQSNQLLQDAQSSGSQMQIVTSALQSEASQIRSILQKQTDDLSSDLSRAEKQFLTIGDGLKQRTDAAYTLLDRVASHYNEITRSAAQELETRAQRFEQTTGAAQSKADAFGALLVQQLGLIGSGGTQLETHAQQIAATGTKTVQQLSALNEKLALTHEAANGNAQSTLARLDEVNNALMRQTNSLADASQSSISQVQKAGVAFGEQAGKMLDNSHQTEQQIRNLTVSTTSLAEQSTQIRGNMEQQTQRLVAQLTEAVIQLEAAGGRLQQTAAAASNGTDQAAVRLTEATKTASSRLSASEQELQGIATRTENTLSSLGSQIAQQSATLSVVHDQLADQFGTISAANENQRNQLVDLFEKLGGAHTQASDVAERTILRLSESLQQIQRQLGALSDQSQSAIANVRTAGSGFADQAGAFLQNAQQAEQQARTVLTVTASLQEQARQLREALHTEGERTNDLLGTLLGKITSGSHELRDLGSSAELILTSLQSGVQQQTQGLSTTMQQITERQRALTVALDSQRDVINGLLNRFALAQDETAATAERTVGRITDSTQQVSKQLTTIEQHAQTTVQSVTGASTRFAEESSSLNQYAQQAEQQARAMLSVSSSLQDQARQLSESLRSEGERSAEVLTSLLNRLTVGSSDLRDISTATEMALTGVQHGFTQQAMALNSTISQTTEKQRSLTVSLEAQRESIHDIFNRLTLAQDETASTTERTVARLTDSTQQIAKQLGSIENQAQTTLATVQSASARFADESGSMELHAQQAEQQMRAVLSVTANMQEQARTLRDSMQGESARVVEQLNEVIARLDHASNQLKQQTGAAAHVLDQSVLRIESATRSSGDNLQLHSSALAEAASVMEGRLSSTEDRIRGHLKLVEEAANQTENQGQQVADTIQSAVGCITILRDSMTESDRQGRNLLAGTTDRIDAVRDALSNEVQRLTETSQAAAQQVSMAARDLSSQSDVLRGNLASSESALVEAARLIRDETIQLPALLDRSTSQIVSAADLLKTQSGESNKSLVATADRFISVSGAARDTMVDEMKQIGRTAADAEEVLRRFNQSLAEQVSSMQTSAGVISASQKELIANAGDSITQLSIASERLGELRGDAAQSAEKLAREFETLESRAAATNQRLNMAGDSLGKNLDVLTQATERAEGQMLAASNGFREQFERIRSGVQGQIDEINRGLMQITAQLERTGAALRSTTQGTVSDVEKISSRFDQTSKQAAAQLGEKTVYMRSATEEVAKLLSGLGDQLDVLLDRLSMAGDGIRRHEGNIVGQMQTALTHLGSVAERLESSRALAGNVSEHAVARLSEVAATVEQQIENLSNKSEGASTTLRNVGKIYADQTQSLNRGVQDAQTQVVTMNRSIEDMQQRTDRLRVSLKLQGEELMGSLQQILDQLGSIGDDLGDNVNAIRERAVGTTGPTKLV